MGSSPPKDPPPRRLHRERLLPRSRPLASQQLTQQRPTLAELEKTYISRLLEEFGGHRARVARLLGISERTLYRKLKGL